MVTRSLIALLSVFLMGAGCGWGLHVALAPQAKTPSIRAATLSQAEPARPAVSACEIARPQPAKDSPETSAQAAPKADIKALLDKVRAEEHVEAPTGIGEVTGRVVDEDGTPVPGASLKLNAWGATYEKLPWHFPVEDKDEFIESIIRYWVRREKHAANALRTTVSDAEGRFVFKHLPEGEASIQGTHAEGELRGPGNQRWASAKAGQFIELRLIRMISLEVFLQADNASAKVKVFVEASQGSETAARQEAEMGGSTTLLLAPGTYVVFCRLDNLLFETKTAQVTITRGQQPPPVTLSITAKPRLFGRISFGVARPTHLEVRAYRLRPGLSDEELAESEREPAIAYTQHDGSFSFGEIQRGEYLLLVQASGRTIARTRAWAAPSSPAVAISIEAPLASQCLLVTLYFAEGARGGNADFTFVDAKGESRWFEVWSESAVRYRLVAHKTSAAQSDDTSGTLYVRVDRLGTASASVKSLRGEAVVSFQKPATLKITARNVSEETWRAINMHVDAEGRHERGIYAEDERWQDGTLSCEVKAIQPGRYVVALDLYDALMERVTQTIDVGADGAELNLEMPTLYGVRLDGKSHNLAGGANIAGTEKVRGRSVVFLNSSVAILRYVAAGQYKLTYRLGDQYKDFEFTVTGSDTFKIP